MKRIPLFLLFAFALALSSCISTTTTAPDGTVTKTDRVDPEAFKLGADVARDVAAHQYARREVLAEK